MIGKNQFPLKGQDPVGQAPVPHAPLAAHDGRFKPPSETLAENEDNCFSTLRAPHFGQLFGVSFSLRTSTSNPAPHLAHLYSNNGMTTLPYPSFKPIFFNIFSAGQNPVNADCIRFTPTKAVKKSQ